MSKVILCDVDGTIALMMGKRTPFEYIKADQDEPNIPVINAVKQLAEINKYDIVFLSARENVTFATGRSKYDNAYDLTKDWIIRHVYDRQAEPLDINLILRQKGDWRTDWVVKYEIYRKNAWDVAYVFDDRDQVVKMWRDIGLTCFQVANGNF